MHTVNVEVHKESFLDSCKNIEAHIKTIMEHQKEESFAEEMVEEEEEICIEEVMESEEESVELESEYVLVEVVEEKQKDSIVVIEEK